MDEIHVPNPVDLAATHQMDMSQLEDLLGPDAFRLTPATLAYKLSQGEWYPYKHLLYLSSIIAYELSKGNARLIISMPPRHGKSELCTVWTPVWFLDKYPKKQIIALSYGADLAEEFGQKARDVILADMDEDGAHLLNPDCYIQQGSSRVNRFLTEKGGGMRSVGIGGAVYGRGADLLLIDDYYKNLEEATSEETRKSIATWVKSVGRSRLLKGGSILIVATRWNTDDLSAELLKQTGSKYKEIRLPAYAEPGDPLGRAVGEPLCPELITLEDLQELKDGMGSFLFDAMYQQVPKVASSGLFDRNWVKIIDTMPPLARLRCVRSWDRAGTEGGGDFTAGLKMYVDTETSNVYLADMVHGQWGPGTVEQTIDKTAENDGHDVEVLLEQEPGSSGKAVAEGDQKRLVAKGYIARIIKHTGDKLIRALPFFAAAERGQVYMLKGPWNERFLDECVAMPDGTNDDMVDTVSQGYNFFFQRKKKAGSFGRDAVQRQQQKEPPPGAKIITGVTWGRRR